MSQTSQRSQDFLKNSKIFLYFFIQKNFGLCYKNLDSFDSLTQDQKKDQGYKILIIYFKKLKSE